MTLEEANTLHNAFRPNGKWHAPYSFSCKGTPPDKLLSLDQLYLVSPDSDWIARLSASRALRSLAIKTPRTRDLHPLGELALLQFELSYPTRIKDWRFLSRLTGLRRLVVDGATTFTDLSCMSGLADCEFLRLGGGYSKPLRASCLNVLTAMKSLKAICLVNVRLEDWNLSPLPKLTALRLLYTPRWCPAAEVKRLREAIPNLSWNWDET